MITRAQKANSCLVLSVILNMALVYGDKILQNISNSHLFGCERKRCKQVSVDEMLLHIKDISRQEVNVWPTDVNEQK